MRQSDVIGALIFDFDGLLLDTETPLFEAWSATYAHFGVEPIDLDAWRSSVGLHDADPGKLDPLGRLTLALGDAVAADAINAHRRILRDEHLGRAELQPGAITLLTAAHTKGIPLAIATSSPLDWVSRHLEPRGILDLFAVVSCAGDGVPGKPHPATYLEACQRLGVDPTAAIAFEDSPNGVRAARAAGLHCVAVPNTITAGCDLSDAHHITASLAEFNLPDANFASPCLAACPLC